MKEIPYTKLNCSIVRTAGLLGRYKLITNTNYHHSVRKYTSGTNTVGPPQSDT